MRMGKSDKIAFEWLLKKGYKKEDIRFSPNSTPDFRIGTETFEAKRVINRKRIYFWDTQIKGLFEDTKIIVVDLQIGVIDCLFYNELKEKYNVKVVNAEKLRTKKRINITLDEDLLRSARFLGKGKLSKTINKLLSEYLDSLKSSKELSIFEV